jgi:CRP/FNR family cyclic AMP-dependent transcriptional regulator
MENVGFGAGQTIFSEGDASTYTYRIIAGSVDIVIAGQDGDERKITSIGPDEVFGEMGIIDPAPRSATAIAREQTVCEAYTADEVIAMMSSDPAKAMDLLKSLIIRLRSSNRKLAAKRPPGPPKPSGLS